VQLRIADLTYQGSVYTPDDGAVVHPTVVLHHGFGSTRLEAFGLFVQLSRALAARGIKAVAFDRAGHGESDGRFFDTTVSGDILASREIVQAVRDWPDVDEDNLHLLGMSLGAVVASVVAAEIDVPIASLTLLSPAAVFVDDVRSGRMQGRAIDDPEGTGYFDNNSARLGPGFFDDARAFDVYGRAAGFDGPVRIIHGGQDDVVPEAYVLRYQSVYGARAEVTILPEGDHVWSTVPVREELIARTVDFVTRQAASASVIG
jgi:pimeloyl-ACP methyl ester carboxylesterase